MSFVRFHEDTETGATVKKRSDSLGDLISKVNAQLKLGNQYFEGAKAFIQNINEKIAVNYKLSEVKSQFDEFVEGDWAVLTQYFNEIGKYQKELLNSKSSDEVKSIPQFGVSVFPMVHVATNHAVIEAAIKNIAAQKSMYNDCKNKVEIIESALQKRKEEIDKMRGELLKLRYEIREMYDNLGKRFKDILNDIPGCLEQKPSANTSSGAGSTSANVSKTSMPIQSMRQSIFQACPISRPPMPPAPGTNSGSAVTPGSSVEKQSTSRSSSAMFSSANVSKTSMPIQSMSQPTFDAGSTSRLPLPPASKDKGGSILTPMGRK